MAAQATILIVDDERDLVDAYVRLLERAGHRCFGAFDANEAIQLIDAESPDLVITDLSLPDTSGIEVVRHIRSKSKDTPIIVMSGHNTPELNEAAHAAGANMSLLKPVSIAVLRRVIAEALAPKARA
jgi:two-component system response regulator PilR (NtrC family)